MSDTGVIGKEQKQQERGDGERGYWNVCDSWEWCRGTRVPSRNDLDNDRHLPAEQVKITYIS